MKTLALMIMLTTSLITEPLFAAKPGARGQPQISRERAAHIARERYGGKVLNIRPQRHKGRNDYRVKLLRDGRVRIINVDGDSGRIR